MFKLKSYHTFVNEAWMKTSPLSGELMAEYGDHIEKLHLYDWGQGFMELNMIRLRSDKKNQGLGTEIMKRIVDYADQHNKTLHLTPTEEFGSSKARLTKFYKRFGFVANRGENKIFQIKDTMLRFPVNVNEDNMYKLKNIDDFIGEANTFYYIGPNPTVDLAVFRDDEVLLIRRAKSAAAEPGKWALPGGFHDTTAKKGEEWREDKESAQQAALRELKEETGLSIGQLKRKIKYVGTYEGNGRDPRDNDESWTRSTAFAVKITPDMGGDVRGLDDADRAEWINIKKAMSMKLAFDHSKILKDAIAFSR